MKKIWDFIVGILKQSDKRLHIYCGFGISLVAGIFVPWCGIIAAAVAGGLKELWDSMGHGCVELADFLCTVAGGALAIPFSILIHNLIW